jgi:hypothetical protein
VVALAFVCALVTALVVPRIDVEGEVQSTDYGLDASQPTPGLRQSGDMTRNVYGFVVGGFGSGTGSFTPRLLPPKGDAKRVLAISAGGGPDAPTRVTLVDRAGDRHLLGVATNWQNHRVDVGPLVGGSGGRVRLEFSATNRGLAPRLVGDRVIALSYPDSALPDAGRWEVAAWVSLVVLLGLALLRRVRRDWLVVPAAGLTAFLVWQSILDATSEGLPFPDLWESASHASWFDLDHGLISGTFEGQSSLTVQLFHLLTPITGTGATGARTASMLVGIGAVIAIYALGRRVADFVGAATAVTCALLADAFRLSLSNGDSTSTLVLAATLFLLAVHAMLLRPGRGAAVLLGAAGAIAVLAEPTWWPGVLAAIAWLALREAAPGTRSRVLVAGLAAFALVSLPSRVSVAHQADGDMTADVTARTTLARNVEFVGRDHGAPADKAALAADPYAGQKVGLGAYVFGDHSLSVVAGGALSGGYDGFAASAARPESKIFGLLAFLVEIAGVVYLLLLPRLRLLVLLPALVALVPWFIADRHGITAFAAQTAFWPALLVGAASLAYAVLSVARERTSGTRVASAVGARAGALRKRRRRSAAQAG